MTRMRSRIVFSDQKLTVTAVEALDFRTGKTSRGGFVIGSLTPIAVIVSESGRTREIDLESGGIKTKGRD